MNSSRIMYHATLTCIVTSLRKVISHICLIGQDFTIGIEIIDLTYAKGGKNCCAFMQGIMTYFKRLLNT